MNASVNKMVIMLSATLLQACSGYSHLDKETYAIVFILNTIPQTSRSTHDVFVTEKKVASLRGGEYTRLRLLPGSYNISVVGTRKLGRNLSLLEMTVGVGEKRYLVYDEELKDKNLVEYGETYAREWIANAQYIRAYPY